MHLHRVDLDEILAELPLCQDFDAAVVGFDGIDLLITVSGFEPRLDAVAKRLNLLRVPVRRACYLTYEAHEAANAQTRDTLLHALHDLTSDLEPVAADTAEDEFTQSLLEVIVSAARTDGQAPRVVVDISVASSRLLARSMHVLLHADIRLVVGYSEAATYFPTQEQFEEWKVEREKIVRETAESLNAEERYDLGVTPDTTTLGLDYGASKVDFLKDFRVQHLEALPDRVIVFPAYNGARARLFLANIDATLLDNHPNDAVTWLVGNPLHEEDKWRFDAMAAANSLVDREGATHERAEPVTTFDYIEVLREIGRTYEANFGAEKVTICAMGSKMQNLGALMFCELHSDVRLGHALPEKYTTDPYSDGVAQVWGINFGSTRQLRATMSRYGTAQIID